MASDVRTTKASMNQATMPVSSPAATELAKATASSRTAAVAPTAAPGKSFSDELARTNAEPKRSQPQAKDAQRDDRLDDRLNSKTNVKADDKGTNKTDNAAPDKNDKTDKADRSGPSKQAQARKTLTPLKKAIDQTPENKAAVENAPVLAFLSGHLEKLQPAALPGLVSDNAFIADALSQANVGEFLNEPTTVGDLLESLDLPASVTSEAEMLGLDLSTVVTPSDILRTLGIDPQRVGLELTQLRANLATTGMAPYMQKAASLRGELAAAGDGLANNLRAGTPLDQGLSGDAQRDLQRRGAGMPPSPLNIAHMQAAQAASMAPAAAATPAAAGVSSSPVTSIASTSSVGASAKASGASSMSTATAMPQGFSSGAGAGTGSASLDAAFLKQLTDVVGNGAVNATPQLKAGSFDAFAAMNERLLGANNVVSTDFTTDLGKGVGQTTLPSLNEQLLAGALVGQGAQPLVALSVDGDPDAAQLVPEDLANGLPADLAQTSSRLQMPNVQNVGPSTLAQQLMNQSNFAAKPTASDATSLKDLIADSKMQEAPGHVGSSDQLLNNLINGSKNLDATRAAMSFENGVVAKPTGGARPIEELQLKMPTLNDGAISLSAVRGERQNFDSAGRDSEREGREGRDGQRSLDSLSQGLSHLGQHSKAAGTGSFSLAGPEKSALGMTPQQRAEFVQKVLDQATAIMKDGKTGTVRLDLGSHEFGQLEMAVSMKDDKLDLKIMTASDRTRDLLSGELNGLRDALSVQNVQLGKVDVGVGGRHPGSSFNEQAFAQQGQQNSQRQQNAFTNGQSFSDGASRGRQDLFDGASNITRAVPRAAALTQTLGTMMPSASYAQAYNQSGRLQVRA